MTDLEKILEDAFQQAGERSRGPVITDEERLKRVRYVVRFVRNRTGVRLLMICLLTKLYRPKLNVRKLYARIGSAYRFSKQTKYDKAYLNPFVKAHNLPCSSAIPFPTPWLCHVGRVFLPKQHLNSPKSSRLPVLVVAAAYQAAESRMGEQVRSLHSHNAADLQTGALGDVEITLVGQNEVVTSYEMKAKEFTTADIDLAISKISRAKVKVDNYIFITTVPIEKEVTEYAAGLYQATGGIEFAVLDCVGFLRHFLHFFHRLRTDFLEAYQALVLAEPDSAVHQPLKEVFLNLRRAAEVDSSA